MRSITVTGQKRPAQVDAGPAPMLQWIRIEHLVVDESYQRELGAANWKAIQRIAAQFRWSRFSPVFVAPIEGGRFAIIDGQHRTHAAAICGMAEVPCQVVQMTVEEQAASFAAVNGLVTKVTLWQIFKAALAAGQPWAVACEKICADGGCRLMTSNRPTEQKKPGQIFALALIRRYYERGAGLMVTLALKSLRASEIGAEAASYANDLLRPWLDAVVDRPWLADVNGLAAFLDEFDVYAAIDRAAENAKRKQRLGFAGVSRFELAAIEIGEGLDKAFAKPKDYRPLHGTLAEATVA
jgi:hypothetical protein